MAYIDPITSPLPEPTAMHIPDGFISVPVAAAAYVAAGVAVAYAVRRTDREFQERLTPLMGIMAAFVFAAQMMNFPVAGGTSGHMLGAALAAILLGPWAAMIVMLCVVGVQALVFQDGGLVALGTNTLNMAVAGVLVGYGVYKGVTFLGNGRAITRYAAVFAAAWLSVQAAAILASLELVLSDTSPQEVVLPAMIGVHALIGVGEGLISMAVLAFVAATRADLLNQGSHEGLSVEAH